MPPRTDYEEFSFPWFIHALVERCLKEEPNDRPKSITEIYDEICFARIMMFQAVEEHERK